MKISRPLCLVLIGLTLANPVFADTAPTSSTSTAPGLSPAPVKGFIDPGSIMLLMMIASSLGQLGDVYKSLLCTKYTSAAESCTRLSGELTNVMNLCAQDKDKSKSEQLANALKIVRQRYETLKQLHDQNAGKVRACFIPIKQMANAIADFGAKLDMTEAYCK